MQDTIDRFVEELNKKFPPKHDWSETFVVGDGTRYHKVWRFSSQRDRITSIYAFVDKKTGDLYKPASWRIPAKQARGNINDASGLDACGEYSVRYLR